MYDYRVVVSATLVVFTVYPQNSLTLTRSFNKNTSRFITIKQKWSDR